MSEYTHAVSPLIFSNNPIATTKQSSRGNTETNIENKSSSSKINQTDSNSDSDSDNFDSTHSNSFDNQIQSHNITNNMTHSYPQLITATETQESIKSLWKNKIQFKYNNDNNWNTVKLVKRAGKRKRIYPNAWNVTYPKPIEIINKWTQLSSSLIWWNILVRSINQQKTKKYMKQKWES